MRNWYVIAGLAGALLLAGCGGSGSGSPAVPTLSNAASHGAGGQGEPACSG